MTTKDFLIKKNKIVFEVTGVVLVPLDQIEEVEFRELESFFTTTLCGDICPYCLIYYSQMGALRCSGCPMAKKGNLCRTGGSTWKRASTLWSEKSKLKDHAKLNKLIRKYNKEGLTL